MKKKKHIFYALVLSIELFFPIFGIASALPTQIPGQPITPISLAPILKKVLPAVVSIKVEGTDIQNQHVLEELKKYFGESWLDQLIQPFEGLGSGVIIDSEKGYVLTNNHVINQADKISVQINDGREFDAKLVGGDDQSDIALIQLKNASSLTQVTVADSDKIRVGDFSIAVGNPFGLGQTATFGIISALNRSNLNLEGLENFIQTDASINSGNSGGALLNLNGELIGINTAIFSPISGGSVGIGFAIPSNIAKILSQQLIQFGKVRRGLLGIKGIEMNADIAQAFKIDIQNGTFVSEVLPNSSSEKAGIKSGDIIISLNDRPLNSFAELRSHIAIIEPGKKVRLGLLRNGKPFSVEVKLDKNISDTDKTLVQGVTLSNKQLKDGTKVVYVDNVEQESLAAKAGLCQDDIIIGINRNLIHSIDEMRRQLKNKPDIVALKIKREKNIIYLLLR